LSGIQDLGSRAFNLVPQALKTSHIVQILTKKKPELMTSHKNHYLGSGVDTAKGDALVDWLRADHKSFTSPFGLGRVMDGIGGFAGLFSLNLNRMSKPALVASTDGVGTKLLLGLQTNRIEHLGQDLVAMCVNDLYTLGALPLFFLDYYATGGLDSDQFKSILGSIKSSCQHCQMALLGGETAEMPGLYAPKHFDLAGFVVGVVDEDRRLGAHRSKVGDVLIAFKSTGFHSNGFSLIRKWLSERPRPDLVDKLLTPTKLYSTIPELIQRQGDALHALANITGGGISGNLPRVLANDVRAEIAFKALPMDSWMRDFITSNGVDERDVEEVFNLGVGMIAVVDAQNTAGFLADAKELGLEPSVLGKLVAHRGAAVVSYS
jgi:phosphoribosylformylglycinamidine cyclo-ligase